MMAALIVGEIGGFAVLLARFVVGQSAAWHTGAMDPVTALRQIAYYKDRSRRPDG